jgi:hypothetical protein
LLPGTHRQGRRMHRSEGGGVAAWAPGKAGRDVPMGRIGAFDRLQGGITAEHAERAEVVFIAGTVAVLTLYGMASRGFGLVVGEG